MDKYFNYSGTLYKSTLPDPEHHPFFTEVEVEETREHWLVRLFEWNVSRWLRKRSE
jgi:hypothetical protein